MKYFIISMLSLLFSNSIFSTQVMPNKCQMPAVEVLQKRLRGSCSDFAKRTHFIDKIAEQKLTPWSLYLLLQFSVEEYKKIIESERGAFDFLYKYPKRNDISSLESDQSIIFERLLQDCPESFDLFIRMGIVEPLKI